MTPEEIVTVRSEARLEALWEAARAVCQDCEAGVDYTSDLGWHQWDNAGSQGECKAWQIRRLIEAEEGEG